HQEGRGEQHRRIELLYDGIAVRKECRREVKRERRVGVEIIPFDEIADRADEDRLDPAFHVGEINMVVNRGGYGFNCHVRSPGTIVAILRAKTSVRLSNSIGSWRGPRTVPS